MKQFAVTPAAGKRLIAKAFDAMLNVLKLGTVVIVTGTTNGYVAEELLKKIGVSGNYPKKRFFRGITLPPDQAVTSEGRLPDENAF